ncbi:hypothetical protein SUGI_0564290 [Cryptomeria japonica]|nr:hypothetical protein SUGI_0564290 [Cryptomeria japonica]
MEYLHHDCPLQIVHCDLKSSNVLLDANMTALVTDFGISRLSTTNSIDSLSTTTFAVKGSIGYIAPEYGLSGNVSIKGDVYSFGILILEMVTRKRPSDDMFVGDMSLQNESPRERPSMRDVAKALESLKISLMGCAAVSNLTATISELLNKTNPTAAKASDNQSSTF